MTWKLEGWYCWWFAGVNCTVFVDDYSFLRVEGRRGEGEDSEKAGKCGSEGTGGGGRKTGKVGRYKCGKVVRRK